MCHAGERKVANVHDGGAEESHAGEGKVAFGMTAEQRKVMPEREKWLWA